MTFDVHRSATHRHHETRSRRADLLPQRQVQLDETLGELATAADELAATGEDARRRNLQLAASFERLQAETALRQSRDQLEAIIQGVADGIMAQVSLQLGAGSHVGARACGADR